MIKTPSVGLYTLGCKVSQYETEAIAEEFERRGVRVLPFSEVCDIYVINTCTVTAESDRKSRQIIRRAKKKNPNARVLVCGCYSQRSPDEVAAIRGVDVVIGTDNKLSLVDIALSLGEGDRLVSVTDISHAPFEKMSITKAPRTRAYVKIEDGCESRCSYCAIPSARGPVRSKAPADVYDEVRVLCEGGVAEIVLTGIETGSYGADFPEKFTLANLLRELDFRGYAGRIRLGSLAPELCGREFAEEISGLKSIAPHFHISMQSGSDKILRLMKRRYNRAMALENISRLKRLIPDARFTTDLMVGFPCESEEDFLETMSFVREAGLLDAHVFQYSRRHSTPAAELEGQISEDIKAQRSERLIAAVRESRLDALRRVLDEARVLSVIFESRKGGVLIGHSAEFIEVCTHCQRDVRGQMLLCRPTGISDDRLIVEIL